MFYIFQLRHSLRRSTLQRALLLLYSKLNLKIIHHTKFHEHNNNWHENEKSRKKDDDKNS